MVAVLGNWALRRIKAMAIRGRIARGEGVGIITAGTSKCDIGTPNLSVGASLAALWPRFLWWALRVRAGLP